MVNKIFIVVLIAIFTNHASLAKGKGKVGAGKGGSKNKGEKADIARIEKEELEEVNKKIAVAFFQGLFGDKDLSVIDQYVSQTEYIQHNPYVADGATALKEFFQFLEGTPKTKVDIQRVGADGDIVYLHVRDTNPDTGEVQAVMDIFRLDDGLIVEHWDVIQTVTGVESVHDHPFF